MVAALVARAQQYLQQPPANELDLVALAAELHNVHNPNVQEQGAIAQAFENIALAYALIDQQHNDVPPPLPQYEEQLIQPGQLLQQGEDELDPAVQAGLLQRIRRPAQDRPPLAAPPQPQQAPIVVQVQPRPTAAPAEPDICTRIMQVFAQVILWIVSCFSYCFTPQPQQPAPTPQPQPQQQPQQLQVQQPQPPQQEAQQPAQPGIERGVERGVLCTNAMVLRLWDHLQGNGAADQFPQLVEAAIAANGPAGARVQEFAIPRLGQTQVYATELGWIDIHALRAHMNAARLTKGDEVHLLLIDARNRAQIKYYHFNPYTRQIFSFDRLADLTQHLAAAVPVDQAVPFAMRGLRVN